MTQTIFDDGTSTSTKFDVLGRKIASIDQLGRETDYEYDDSGRLIAVTLPPIDPTGKATGTVDQRRPRYEYHYDEYGNQTAVVADLYLTPDGTQIIYMGKDASGNDVQIASRSVSATPLIGISGLEETDYTYDYAGRQHSRTLSLGQTEWRFYDDAPIGSIPAGSLASSTGGGELAFTVDFQGRVTRYLYDNRNGSGGRVVEKDLFSSAGISIDDTTTTTQLAAALTGSPDETVTYQTDALGRNVQTVDSSAGTWNYQYDAEGRQTQVASTAAGILAQMALDHFAASRYLTFLKPSSKADAEETADSPMPHWAGWVEPEGDSTVLDSIPPPPRQVRLRAEAFGRVWLFRLVPLAFVPMVLFAIWSLAQGPITTQFGADATGRIEEVGPFTFRGERTPDKYQVSVTYSYDAGDGTRARSFAVIDALLGRCRWSGSGCPFEYCRSACCTMSN